MKIEFIESFLNGDQAYIADNYDNDGFYFNKNLNSVYCVYTTGTPSAAFVTFVCSYDSLVAIHKYQQYQESKLKEERRAELTDNALREMSQSKAVFVSTPDPTVRETFALRMLAIAMDRGEYKDI
jgi:hypothetical protein